VIPLPVFPSVEWFDNVRSVANADPAFRGLGTCNADVGVRVGDAVYLLSFEAFECAGVSEGEERDLLDVNFYLDMEPEAWRSLLANIRDNDGADSERSFNTLDIENGIVGSPNPYGLNDFARYHLTIQRFFDLSGRVETTFQQ